MTKLTEAQMQLMCLGAAMYRVSPTASRIVANALDEMTAKPKRKKAIKAKRRRKK